MILKISDTGQDVYGTHFVKISDRNNVRFTIENQDMEECLALAERIVNCFNDCKAIKNTKAVPSMHTLLMNLDSYLDRKHKGVSEFVSSGSIFHTQIKFALAKLNENK